MKKIITTIMTSAMLAMTFVPATTALSHAKSASPYTIKINGEGFRKCKALGASGYTAIVRGESTYRSNLTGGLGKFKVRSCFETKAECAHFVTRGIGKVLLGISEIDYTSCTRRS